MNDYCIGLMVPVDNRQNITYAVLNHYGRMEPLFVDLVRVAVVSNDADERMVHSAAGGWHVVHAPNSPLSRKHNAGVRAAYNLGVDAVCNVGSDVLISAPYFTWAVAQLHNGEEIVRFIDCVYYDVPTGRITMGYPAYPGAGTVLTRRVIEDMGLTPWDADQDKMLDTLLYNHVIRLKYRPYAVRIDEENTVDIQLCELKGEHNLWSYDAIVEIMPGTRDVGSAAQYFQRSFPDFYRDNLDLLHHA